jgi:hypothetical protein
MFEFKNIAKAKPKYYHLTMQGPTSALWCEVLICCSQGRLPCLLPVLGLTIGPHLITTACAILRHVCTQITCTSKAWATKAQQDWSVNMAISSQLLACKGRMVEALYYVEPTLRVEPYFQVLAFSIYSHYLLSLTSYIQIIIPTVAN